MKESIAALKEDLEAVDALAVYNLSSGSFDYTDLPEVPPFLASLHNLGCLSGCQFLYFDTESRKYFIHRHGNHATVVHLNPRVDVNKVLLELKVKRFGASYTG